MEFDCHQSDGNPLDLTGAAIEWVLADSAGNIIVTKTVSDGGVTILSPAKAGRVMLALAPEDTAGIAAGKYRDQLRVTIPDFPERPGLVTTQSVGRIEVVAPLA
jgi:hypothetical protein